MIVFTSIACPYCKTRNERSINVEDKVAGNDVVACHACELDYVVFWRLIINSEAKKIEGQELPA